MEHCEYLGEIFLVEQKNKLYSLNIVFLKYIGDLLQVDGIHARGGRERGERRFLQPRWSSDLYHSRVFFFFRLQRRCRYVHGPTWLRVNLQTLYTNFGVR